MRFECEKRSWAISYPNWKRRHMDLLDDEERKELENEDE